MAPLDRDRTYIPDGTVLNDNEEEEWFFETILNSRQGQHSLEYKIK